MFLRQAITSGEHTVAKVKKVIAMRCAVMELSEALKTADDIKIDPVKRYLKMRWMIGLLIATQFPQLKILPRQTKR